MQRPRVPTAFLVQRRHRRRNFHDYFVTHLPSTSMHPDSRSSPGPRHNLPRNESKPHAEKTARTPASWVSSAREMTVVRIPLKSAKHHFGAFCSRGTRLYNEDTYQAGTIELPSFAKKPPVSLVDKRKTEARAGEGTAADGAGGDPQVFYFGVFDGHGGDSCSTWLRENLHHYVEESAAKFRMKSTLRKGSNEAKAQDNADKDSTANENPEEVEQALINSWRETVGGYFRRFQPDHFPEAAGGRGKTLTASAVRNDRLETPSSTSPPSPDPDAAPTASAQSAEAILTYSFLLADLDFITDRKSIQGVQSPTSKQPKATPSPGQDSDPASEDEEDDEPGLGRHSHHSAAQPFLGGSTCSLALISTPTPTPFWHPSSPFSILTAHLGDTRILLCSTASGTAIPLTPTHHPSSPSEAARLRRYAAAFTTDSFGEERISGLANTRAFGDRRSKRIGVSAEPALTLLHAAPAQFSFLVLVSDGVTGVLADQEIVDVVKEAKTPEQGAKDVVGFATEVGSGEQGDADNATCVCVRLGGWERRSEGGVGSLGTREAREWRRREAGSAGGRRT